MDEEDKDTEVESIVAVLEPWMYIHTQPGKNIRNALCDAIHTVSLSFLNGLRNVLECYILLPWSLMILKTDR
jgi:hypothetical protein